MKYTAALLILAAGLLAGTASPAAEDATARFHALYTREWTWREAQFAGGDDENQTRKPADHLPRVDEAAQMERERYWAAVLDELHTIKETELSPAEQVNYEVYEQQIATLLEDQRVREWQMPLNSDTAFWTDLGFAAREPFQTAENYRRYLAMLADVPRYFDEQIANMRAGLKRGFSVPRVTLTGRDQSIADVASGKAAIETAKINLAYARVTSPIPGRTGRSSVTEGALVTLGQTNSLVTVTQLDPIYVDVAQSSDMFLRLKRALASGQIKTVADNVAEVKLILDDGTTYDHPGQLQFSEGTVNPATGSITLRAVFPNEKGLLLPGMFVQETIEEGIRQNAVVAPQRGVTHDVKGEATALVVGPDGKVALSSRAFPIKPYDVIRIGHPQPGDQRA